MTDLRGRNPWYDVVAGLNAGQHLAVDAVVAFVDGELGAGAHDRAAVHLSGCPSCAAEVAAQRQARSAVRSAAEPAAPSSLLAALRSIPQTVELTHAPDGLAVTSDGTIVAVPPAGPATAGLGDTAPLGAAPPRGSSAVLGASRSAPAGKDRSAGRQGAGSVVSGLVLGALIMVTPGGTPVSDGPRVPAPAPPAAPGVPLVDSSSAPEAAVVQRGATGTVQLR